MLRAAAGLSDILADARPVQWLEIHAENYMGDGGRPLAQLRHLADRFPISVHGVGLSIGGEGPLDRDHLARLKQLCDWLQPASFSEHLAWSSHDSAFLNDLLPLPYTDATIARLADHIDQVQDTLGRRMLLENPSSYLAFAESTWAEPDVLRELTRRTGCGLLLDVNNVFVSATNLGFDPPRSGPCSTMCWPVPARARCWWNGTMTCPTGPFWPPRHSAPPRPSPNCARRCGPRHDRPCR